MKKFFTMMIRQFKDSPFKMGLTLIAVSLGAFILVLSFNITDIIEKEVENQLNTNGIIVQVANASWDSDKSVDYTKPSEWDTSIQNYLLSDTEEIEISAIISQSMFNQFTYDGTSYDLRNSVATEQTYFEIFDLDLVSGVLMSQEDIDLGLKKVWISEETAQIIFGSAENAIDKWIQPPGKILTRGINNKSQNVVTQYKITGVYETPSEIKRKVYGIGDLIVPYTSMLPSSMNVEFAKDMLSGSLVVKSNQNSIEDVEQSILQVVYQNYGEDVDLLVWEGFINGESSYMQDLRETVDVFTVSINILGLTLMLVSTLGLFSVMLVEALNRKRHICIERSLGASKMRIIKEFWSWSIAMSFMGVIIGTTIAYFSFPSILEIISPLFGELSNQINYEIGFSFIALIKSISLILVFGGVFGVIPVIPVVRENIAEGIKEE